MGYGIKQEDILYTLHQCVHCGDWLNDKGFVDLDRKPKIKTVGGVHCRHCKTKAMRDDMDKENAKILGGK